MLNYFGAFSDTSCLIRRDPIYNVVIIKRVYSIRVLPRISNKRLFFLNATHVYAITFRSDSNNQRVLLLKK